MQHLTEAKRARLLVVYFVAPRPLVSSLWNNSCDLVYQTPSKTYRRQIPAAFGIPGHMTTKYLPDTPATENVSAVVTMDAIVTLRAVYMIWAPGENS